VQPGDSEELANAIAQMLSSPRLLEEYGRQARHAVLERYNSAFEIRKLLALYKAVLSC
jgi:glycosyltransferase involved in cell wall biosynthesis